MLKNNYVRIFLKIPACGILLECVCRDSLTFNEILPAVFEIQGPALMQEFQPDERTLVYEKRSQVYCDRNIPLSAYGDVSGRLFLLI